MKKYTAKGVSKKVRVGFWRGMFRPRTTEWKQETLTRLTNGQSIFETAQERADKVDAIKQLLAN